MCSSSSFQNIVAFQEGERKEKFLKKVEQRKSFSQYMMIHALFGAKEHLIPESPIYLTTNQVKNLSSID